MPYKVTKHSFLVVLFLIASALTLSGQKPSFRSTTQLVEVDTVAIDSNGKPVTDLRANELRLFEDGVERPLSHFSFERVEPLDAKEVNRIHELADKKGPGVYANFTHDSSVVPPNGCTVLLIDWLNTPVELQPSAEQELKKFIDSVDLSKPLAIYALDNTFHQIQSFTSDRQVMRNSVQKYGLHVTNLQPHSEASHNLDSQMTDFREMSSVSALLNIARTLESVRGHKSLIWLSGGFPLHLIPTNRFVPPAEQGANGWTYGERRDYFDLLTQVSRALSSANIAVYPVDAQGLQGNMTNASQESIRFYISPITQATMERQETMVEVADLTGGRVFYNHNDIGKEIATAYEDGNVFYALAFTPAKNNPDGKLHTIRVECRRSGVHLRYRKSYYAEDPQVKIKLKRSELEALARTLGQSADGLPFMAEVDKKQNDRLKLWLDGASLAILGGPSPFLNVDIDIATFDSRGNLLQQNYAEMKIRINDQQLHNVRDTGMSQTVQFARSNECARVRVAVRDLVSGRVGTLEVPLP